MFTNRLLPSSSGRVGRSGRVGPFRACRDSTISPPPIPCSTQFPCRTSNRPPSTSQASVVVVFLFLACHDDGAVTEGVKFLLPTTIDALGLFLRRTQVQWQAAVLCCTVRWCAESCQAAMSPGGWVRMLRRLRIYSTHLSLSEWSVEWFFASFASCRARR